MEKRPGDLRKSGPTTDSPILDTDMVEEDRLAWQQLATGAQLRKTPDEDHPMLGDIDTTGDDWESLDAEDFPMEEAEPKQDLSTDRQILQPQIESVNRQTDPSAGQRQLMLQQPETKSVNMQTDPSTGQRQLMQRPQFPADAQMQRSANGRNWQVVPTR